MNIKLFKLCVLILSLCLFVSTAQSTNNLNLQLYLASIKGDLQKVKELVEKGANTNAVMDFEQTPLMVASIKGHYAVVKYLLSNGADTKIVTNDGKAVLHYASRSNAKLVRLLINNGANADIHDKQNLTPLSGAIVNSNFKVMKLLIEYGAHIDDTSQWGRTVLMEAAESGDISFVRYLLEKGAKVNTVEKGVNFTNFNPRQTALLGAVKKHRPDVVKLLLDYGANAHIPDDQNRTPIDWAKRYQYTDILKIFQDYNVMKKPSTNLSK